MKNLLKVMDMKFCHGDLWSDNIMVNNKKEIVLIDFDKTIYFCKSYDLVYYYLITFNIPPSI